jgi:hypothetical protein
LFPVAGKRLSLPGECPKPVNIMVPKYQLNAAEFDGILMHARLVVARRTHARQHSGFAET